MAQHKFLIVISVIVVLLILVNLLLYFFPDMFLGLPNWQPFKSVWSENDKSMLKSLLQKIQKITKEHDIQLIAMWGTLLGIKRHKGLIPWDDDVDFVININKKKLLLSLKDKFSQAGIGMIEFSSNLVKIFDLSSTLVPGQKWGWPYIDIFYYKEKDNKVITKNAGAKGCFSWWCQLFLPTIKINKKDFFPLRISLFEGIPVHVPNNTNLILESLYGKNWRTFCVPSSFNHRLERPVRQRPGVPCKDLKLEINKDIFDNAWVINLDRRPERWKSTNSKLSKLGIKAHLWSATDKESEEVRKKFSKIKTRRNIGEVACYMSHLKLWSYLFDQGVEFAIIFEDDIEVPKTLTLEMIIETLNDSKGFNVLFLGHCGTPQLHRNSNSSSRVGWGSCTHSYAVSREGLRRLLSYKHDFSQEVDRFLVKFCQKELCYYARNLPSKSTSFGDGLFHQSQEYSSDLRGKKKFLLF